MEEKDPENVLDHLAQLALGKPTSKKLIFDPQTQELILVDAKAPQRSPDAITADEPTRDGFFANAFNFKKRL